MKNQRWIIVSYIVASLACFLVFQQLMGAIWDYFRLPLFDQWPVSLPDVVAVLLALGVFLGLKLNVRANSFMADVIVELGKVTWPARKETVLSAVIVVVMVGIASLVLFLFDSLWGSLTQKLLAF